MPSGEERYLQLLCKKLIQFLIILLIICGYDA